MTANVAMGLDLILLIIIYWFSAVWYWANRYTVNIPLKLLSANNISTEDGRKAFIVHMEIKLGYLALK